LSNKIIIPALIIFLIISFFYLAYTEQYQRNSGDWWALYFENPKSDNLNFVIENHSGKTNFHWEVSADKEKIKEGGISVAKGSTWKSGFQVTGNNDKKITIEVLNGDEKKEIYKNTR
jgi:hypothetical protein